MKTFAALLALLALPLATQASPAYGSLNNFDVVNDTGNKCYGFSIELDDLHSTDITYTYDFNHYGTPKISEDATDPLHPKVLVRYEAKKNSDGSFASFTNPQDPAHPLPPTAGHAFTDPSVNLGGEHFGVGFARNPGIVTYHWLVDDPVAPGTLAPGPSVNVATPQFVYVPAAPAAPAQAQVVIVPPAPEVPEINNVAQFGVPVWVKVLKTVQKSGKHIPLGQLLPDDPDFPNPNNWAGDEPPETEIEWQVFQKRPPGNPAGGGEMEAQDKLKNGDETVTRRYEFYVYNGPVNADDGEAQCSDTNSCPGAIGPFISAQMAAFNIVTPLGLIDHLQDGDTSVPYVDRTLVTGGNTPYVVAITTGTLPDGLSVDPVTGVLSGTPATPGTFSFSVKATDADAATAEHAYALHVAGSVPILPPVLSFQLNSGVLTLSWPQDHLGWHLQIQTKSLVSGLGPQWTVVPGSGDSNQFTLPMDPANDSVFLRLVQP